MELHLFSTSTPKGRNVRKKRKYNAWNSYLRGLSINDHLNITRTKLIPKEPDPAAKITLTTPPHLPHSVPSTSKMTPLSSGSFDSPLLSALRGANLRFFLGRLASPAAGAAEEGVEDIMRRVVLARSRVEMRGFKNIGRHLCGEQRVEREGWESDDRVSPRWFHFEIDDALGRSYSNNSTEGI